MIAKYLLPCPCGQQVVVEPRQAGETVPCSCGEPLLVPSLLDMTSLDSVSLHLPVGPAASAWGLKRALQFIGTILIVVAFILGVVVYWNRPVSRFDAVDPERIQQTYQQLSPSQTWQTWQDAKQGLDRRADQPYADALRVYHIEWSFVGVLAFVGAVIVITGTAVARGRD